MSQPAKAQEPSMEEILASIRRIIADDEPARATAPLPTAPKPTGQRPLPPPAPRAVVPPQVRAITPEPPLRPSAEAALRDMPAPAPMEEPASDILDLTEQMARPEPAAVSEFKTIDGHPDVVFADVAAEPELPPIPDLPPMPEMVRPAAEDTFVPERPLMSNNTMSAVDTAFNTLAHTVLVQNARTLEDLVKEMLRPMLKSWLDDNLPGLVERLVRAEIERVSRGRAS